ncbi:hypothetical protein DFH09DRAFT_1092225 [Mycena vulgaris]|nr:hypothetical protein DFH09DRAFT_1092225 [Mycena vulgaris]
MIVSHVGHTGPIQLMNKDNAAAASCGPSEAKTRTEEVSEGGGVKLTSLAGMLFHHKDAKKGQGDLFRIFFEDKLGYQINFPDTSNTRYQSHCEAAGALLLHVDLYIEFLEHMRDKKGDGTFTNLEKNVYDGLHDPATKTELAVLALYSQAISHPYMQQVRGAGREHTNLLQLGPLHVKVLDHCRQVIAKPDLLLSESANHTSGSMDGLMWDNPEVFYVVQSMVPALPRVHESLIAFFTGALETWERFSEEYSEDGLIAKATSGECEHVWMPTTNNANEGALGELRNMSRHAPNMSLQQLNARRMYKKNDTKIYRQFLRTHEETSHSSSECGDCNGGHEAEQNRERIAKAAKINAELVKITKKLWLTAALVQIDPRTGKSRSNDDLNKQLAWHRRHELSTLKKRSEAQIPGVSKLLNKALKVQALIAAVVLYNSWQGRFRLIFL